MWRVSSFYAASYDWWSLRLYGRWVCVAVHPLCWFLWSPNLSSFSACWAPCWWQGPPLFGISTWSFCLVVAAHWMVRIISMVVSFHRSKTWIFYHFLNRFGLSVNISRISRFTFNGHCDLIMVLHNFFFSSHLPTIVVGASYWPLFLIH